MGRGKIEPAVLAVARTQARLVSAEQCDAHGLSADRRTLLVRRSTWRRVTRGVYDTGSVPPNVHELDLHRLRQAWTAMLGAGPQAIGVGQTALVLLGVRGLPLTIVPEVMLPGRPGTRGPAGVLLRRYDVPNEWRVVNQRLTVPVRLALTQALPGLDRNHAVCVLDSALNQREVFPRELPRIRDAMRGRRGAASVDSWWHLADGRSESPQETLARLDCIDHGLPPDGLQVEMVDHRGRFVARGDLGWLRRDGTWVIAEIDGRESHESPKALFRDRQRQNDMIVVSRARVLRFTAADVRQPGTVAAVVRAALAAE